jgi:hypothetical protein
MNRIVFVFFLGASTLSLASEKKPSLDIAQHKDTVSQNSDCYDVEIYVTTANDRTMIVSHVKSLSTDTESYQGSIIASQVEQCVPVSCPELTFMILKERYEKAQSEIKVKKKPAFALIKNRRNRKK